MADVQGGENARSTGARKTNGTAAKKGTTAKKAARSSAQSAKKAKQTTSKTQGDERTDVIEMLKADHRRVEKLFDQYEEEDNKSHKAEYARQICIELIVHAKLEEELFYPAARDAIQEDEPMDEAQVEHDSAKMLIRELLEGSPNDEYYDAKVSVLAEQIRHHVGEEEKDDGIFAKAREAEIDVKALAEEVSQRREELMKEMDGWEPQPPEPVSFRVQPMAAYGRQMRKETYMPRNGDYMERERSRSSEDDDRRSGRGSQYRQRDEEGRFTSGSRGGSSRYEDDDDRRGRNQYSSRGGSSRYEDEDDDRGGRSSQSRSRGGGRQTGGWFGDPEGHSEASRRGWRNSDHEGSGWYGDPEGHSEASRRGWRNSDHEGSGWYGDSEGHSEAARRGWETGHRSQRSGGSRYEDDDDYDRRGRNQYSSRGGGSRYEDDDDRRGRNQYSSSRSGGGGGRGGQGQGGWFGDSEGHSEAAREGWRNRR